MNENVSLFYNVGNEVGFNLGGHLKIVIGFFFNSVTHLSNEILCSCREWE